VRFGDGTHGAVPGAGAVVVGVYRISADDDGNVGAGAVTRNSSGVAYLTDVTNPRRAAGWAAPEGSTEATLEAVKLSKPGALRAMNRAVTPGDCVALVLDAFLTSDGARPIVRAWATEEEYGVKTVGLHVVGAGGGALSATVLGQVDDFFNGADGDENDPDRRLVANHRVMSSNYVERTVGGALTVTIAGSVLGVESAVQAILTDLLDPLARESDGTWEWEPGGGTAKGRVSPTKVAGAVWRDLAVGNLRDVEVTDVGGGGPVSLVLAANELPVKGAWVVTVVQV
jgi:hypothetical protein